LSPGGNGVDGLGTGIAPALNDPAVREKTAEELTTVITYGRPGTLMASWNKTLRPEEIAALTSLLLRWDEIPAGTIPALALNVQNVLNNTSDQALQINYHPGRTWNGHARPGCELPPPAEVQPPPEQLPPPKRARTPRRKTPASSPPASIGGRCC